MVHVEFSRVADAQTQSHGGRWAELVLAGTAPSVTMTDAYKLAMAQAGFPLRTETFYFSFRKPGWYRIPFDLESAIRALVPAD